MTAAELIEKLGKLVPDTEVWFWSEGCGCCEGGYDPLRLGVHTSETGTVVVSVEAAS